MLHIPGQTARPNELNCLWTLRNSIFLVCFKNVFSIFFVTGYAFIHKLASILLQKHVLTPKEII